LCRRLPLYPDGVFFSTVSELAKRGRRELRGSKPYSSNLKWRCWRPPPSAQMISIRVSASSTSTKLHFYTNTALCFQVQCILNVFRKRAKARTNKDFFELGRVLTEGTSYEEFAQANSFTGQGPYEVITRRIPSARENCWDHRTEKAEQR